MNNFTYFIFSVFFFFYLKHVLFTVNYYKSRIHTPYTQHNKLVTRYSNVATGLSCGHFIVFAEKSFMSLVIEVF